MAATGADHAGAIAVATLRNSRADRAPWKAPQWQTVDAAHVLAEAAHRGGSTWSVDQVHTVDAVSTTFALDGTA